MILNIILSLLKDPLNNCLLLSLNHTSLLILKRFKKLLWNTYKGFIFTRVLLFKSFLRYRIPNTYEKVRGNTIFTPTIFCPTPPYLLLESSGSAHASKNLGQNIIFIFANKVCYIHSFFLRHRIGTHMRFVKNDKII